jgi:hypothetical protein
VVAQLLGVEPAMHELPEPKQGTKHELQEIEQAMDDLRDVGRATMEELPECGQWSQTMEGLPEAE